MATLVQQLHVRDIRDPQYRVVFSVAEDGRINLEVVADGDSLADLSFSTEDSTALVEFIGPKVKQVR